MSVLNLRSSAWIGGDFFFEPARHFFARHETSGTRGPRFREQSLTNRLIDELHSQQTSLAEVFSVLARDPDSVDYDRVMAQLDEADRDIARISEEGKQTADAALWER